MRARAPVRRGAWPAPLVGPRPCAGGMFDWGVMATLVRDNVSVLAVAHLPMTGKTYTAIRGAGAFLDGVRLHPSAKTDLTAALVGTGQARPGESHETHQRLGQSVTAMLDAALVVRVSAPATVQLLRIASGHMDVFWQFSQVRSGLLAGALLVEEASGTVTDTRGRPWNLTSHDVLASAPGLHAAAVNALSVPAEAPLHACLTPGRGLLATWWSPQGRRAA